MDVKYSCMLTHRFKVMNGMTEFMYTLRKLAHLEMQLKTSILRGFLGLLQ